MEMTMKEIGEISKKIRVAAATLELLSYCERCIATADKKKWILQATYLLKECQDLLLQVPAGPVGRVL